MSLRATAAAVDDALAAAAGPSPYGGGAARADARREHSVWGDASAGSPRNQQQQQTPLHSPRRPAAHLSPASVLLPPGDQLRFALDADPRASNMVASFAQVGGGVGMEGPEVTVTCTPWRIAASPLLLPSSCSATAAAGERNRHGLDRILCAAAHIAAAAAAGAGAGAARPGCLAGPLAARGGGGGGGQRRQRRQPPPSAAGGGVRQHADQPGAADEALSARLPPRTQVAAARPRAPPPASGVGSSIPAAGAGTRAFPRPFAVASQGRALAPAGG